MAKQQHLDAIEKTIDTVEETAQTLERIPKVNLNGTTKDQQVLILVTVGVAGVAVGVLANNVIRRGLNKLRRKKSSSVTVG